MVRIIYIFVAPSPSAPCRYPSGTASRAVLVFPTTSGSTISAHVNAPLAREYPSPRTLPKNTIPKSPKITEGIPARISMANQIMRTPLVCPAYSFRYRAAPTPRGTAMASVRTMI